LFWLQVFFLNPSQQVEENLPVLPDWTNLVFNEVLQRIIELFDPDETSMEDIFGTFDIDNTGYITLEEFEETLRNLGFDGSIFFHYCYCCFNFNFQGRDSCIN
jgi:hypothetical protein